MTFLWAFRLNLTNISTSQGMDAEGLSEPTEKGSCEESTVVSVRTGCCSFNPVSGSGKRWHQSQMLLLPFVPIAALIAQNCWSMMNIIIYQTEMKELRRQESKLWS